MKTKPRLPFLTQFHFIVLSIAFAGIANATPLITHTDSFGIVYTLSSDGINHGTAADPTYDLFVLANTTGFSTSSHGVNYTNANAYINDISILANAAPNSLSRTTGPGDITDLTLWTNIPGGQNSNGCNGAGSDFDCTYSSAGGNQPPTGPGVLMNTTMTNPNNLGAGVLEWEFILHFAEGTTDPLSFGTDGSHLKVDYYGFDNSGAYDFIGQISDAVTINDAPPNGVPEPGSLPLLSALTLGFCVAKKLRGR